MGSGAAAPLASSMEAVVELSDEDGDCTLLTTPANASAQPRAGCHSRFGEIGHEPIQSSTIALWSGSSIGTTHPPNRVCSAAPKLDATLRTGGTFGAAPLATSVSSTEVKHEGFGWCNIAGPHKEKLLTRTPLKWAVLKPSAETSNEKCGRARRAAKERSDAPQRAATAGERAVKRSRGLKQRLSDCVAEDCEKRMHQTSDAGADPRNVSAAAVRLSQRATALLQGAIGDDPGAEGTVVAIVDAFVTTHGGAAARRSLLVLAAALRKNVGLRSAVLAAGPAGALELARQDPQEWADPDLRAKRLQWKRECLNEAKRAGGQVGTCPKCGGRALVECGRAGTGRAARLSKQYSHYTCLEERCGETTHIQEG